MTDRQTDGQTDTAHIGISSLHLIHSTQPKNESGYSNISSNSSGSSTS